MSDTYGPDDLDDIDSGIYSPEKMKKTLVELRGCREQLALQLAQIRERADERDAAQADNARLRAQIGEMETERGEVNAALRAELDSNARLRALIKDAEFSNYHQAVDSGFCPWCDGDRRGGHLIKSATCSGTCPAFTPAGTVR